MADVVLDASAILARVRHEPGWETVDKVIAGASVCAVSLTEALQRVLDLGADDASALETVDLPCKIVPFDRDLALQAGLLRRATKPKGLSLGDRACLALGLRLGRPVYTADRAWAELDLGVEVVLIR